MKRISKYFFFATLMLFTFSCDYVEDPIQDDGSNGGGGGEGQLRDVLIMDFTGHQCSNCPNATRTAEEIHDDFPDQVFVLGVHPDISGLSTPVTGGPDDPFTTDFRTAVGIHWQNLFDISFLPAGVISGLEIDGSYFQLVGNWRSVTEELIDDPKIAEIDITLDYDSASRDLSVSTTTTAIQEWSGIYNISVLLVEDSVIDWQKNGTTTSPSDPAYPPGNIPDYVHRHVLRGALNGNEGTGLVLTDQITAPETTFENSFNSSISFEFDHSHMYVYAFVYNANTLEIIDVSTAKFFD